MRAVCGRLESRYRYSNTIVYNNFPWPAVGCAPRTNPNQPYADGAHSAPYQKHITAIETAAQRILDERQAQEMRCAAQNQKCSLALLYAPNTMPVGLSKAHAALDKAVDAAYGYKPNLTASGKASDEDRVAFLFGLYQALIQK